MLWNRVPEAAFVMYLVTANIADECPLMSPTRLGFGLRMHRAQVHGAFVILKCSCRPGGRPGAADEAGEAV